MEYKEANLSQDFCTPLIVQIRELISQGQTFNLVSMPGVGITTFFKYLISTQTDIAHFIYIDIEHQASIGKEEFLKTLDNNLDIEQYDGKVVIIFNHFNLLKDVLDEEILNKLRNFRSQYSTKVVFIFHSDKPIYEIIPQRLLKVSMTLLSKIVYFPTYSLKDLADIAKTVFQAPDDDYLKKALDLSGGHYLLLQLLLRTERVENPLLDPFIQFHFRELIQYLNYKQRKLLEKAALGEKIEEDDPYLINTGIITDGKVYSPLIKEYLKTHASLKLSAGENKLFRFLKSKLNKVVSKDEIFGAVWGEDEFPSDWALNSMIYRIRNNPAFKEQGYEIISYKRVGYRLVKD